MKVNCIVILLLFLSQIGFSQDDDKKRYIRQYERNGKLIYEIEYKTSALKIFHGTFKYFEDGVLQVIGEYRDNYQLGVWKVFDKNGNLIDSLDYSGIHNSVGYEYDTIYDERSHLLDCPNASEIFKQLAVDIEYPSAAKHFDVEGKVYIEFILNKEGKTTNLKVFSSDHILLESEAFRVISNLKLTPCTINGRAVNHKMRIPVSFRVH